MRNLTPTTITQAFADYARNAPSDRARTLLVSLAVASTRMNGLVQVGILQQIVMVVAAVVGVQAALVVEQGRVALVARDHFLLQETVQAVAQGDDVGRVGVGIGKGGHRGCPSGFGW